MQILDSPWANPAFFCEYLTLLNNYMCYKYGACLIFPVLLLQMAYLLERHKLEQLLSVGMTLDITGSPDSFSHRLMFMHLADAFIQSDLQVGRQGKGVLLKDLYWRQKLSCRGFEPRSPTQRWQSYHYTIQSRLYSRPAKLASLMSDRQKE